MAVDFFFGLDSCVETGYIIWQLGSQEFLSKEAAKIYHFWMKARDFTIRKYLSSLSPGKYLSSLYIYTVLPALLLDRERRQKESSREGFNPLRRSFWPAAAAADANGLAIALVLADDRLGPGSESHPQRQPITML